MRKIECLDQRASDVTYLLSKTVWVGVLAVAFAGMAWAGITARAAEPKPRIQTAGASISALDGWKFRKQAIRGDETRVEDLLVFKDGTFVSENCRLAGFSEAPYWIRVEADNIHFLAETVSPLHGTMIWKGTVKGDEMNGSYVWTKVRWYWTIRREHKFKAIREK